jgi:hypothetical protein
MSIPLVPAWVISLTAGAFWLILLRRYRRERNPLLIGKLIALGCIIGEYLIINSSVFGIVMDRSISRFVWLFYLFTEITYHIAREKRKNGIR